MARKLRVEYPGALYHITNRGDRREPVCRPGDLPPDEEQRVIDADWRQYQDWLTR
jgi:hypothetical protein